ncbi:MAG: ATP-binding protein [Acidobacteriota bacterium]
MKPGVGTTHARRSRTYMLLVLIIAGLLYGGAAIEFVWSRRDLLESLEREGFLASDWLARAGEISLRSGTYEAASLDAGTRSALHSLHLVQSNDRLRAAAGRLAFAVARLRRPDGTALFKSPAPHEMSPDLLRFLGLRHDLLESPGRLTARDIPFVETGSALIIEPVEDGTTWVAEVGDVQPEARLSALIRQTDLTGDILYFALQDAHGLIAATPNVRKLDRIDQSPVLQAVIVNPQPAVRQYAFNGRKVLEVVRPFPAAGPALLRVGLSLEGLARIQTSSLMRAGVATGILVIAGVLLLGLLLSQERLQALDRAYLDVETRSRSILDNMSDGLLVTDREGNVVQDNAVAARLFGVPTAVGMHLSELRSRLQGDDIAGGMTARGRVVPGGAEVEATSSALSTGRIILVRDVTELRSVERALAQAEKLTFLGRMASELAHEIGNPLNAISMSTQLLERERPTSTLPATIRKEIDRLNRLVESFLGFRRIADEPWTEIDLADIMHEVVDLFSAETSTKGVIMTSRIESVSSRVRRDRLKQAVINLVKNAIEATPRGGQCSISLESNNGSSSARIEVADSGPGIPPELRSKVFEPFVTLKPGGSGIGLSVAALVAREHGGEIEVRESGLGGALFFLSLPAAAPRRSPK